MIQKAVNCLFFYFSLLLIAYYWNACWCIIYYSTFFHLKFCIRVIPRQLIKFSEKFQRETFLKYFRPTVYTSLDIAWKLKHQPYFFKWWKFPYKSSFLNSIQILENTLRDLKISVLELFTVVPITFTKVSEKVFSTRYTVAKMAINFSWIKIMHGLECGWSKCRISFNFFQTS